MSHPKHTLAHARPRSRGLDALRAGLAVAVSLAACLLVAPAAMAKFGAKALRLGSSSGAVDYLYAAGNTVVEQASVDKRRWYHFDVYDPSGTVRWSSACRPSTSNGTVTSRYTLQSGDPDSGTSGWRFRLREFGNSSSCGSSGGGLADASLYFDVASATSYSSSALTTAQSAFGAGKTAYVQVAGAGKVSSSGTNAAQSAGSWSTTWLLPSGATACANTAGGDLPGSTAAGQLPSTTSQSAPAQANLQYAPSPGSGADPWNAASNYESGPCPAFGVANQGQWSLKLSRDSTHFVTLPVFAVETAAPDTTLTSAPSNATASTSASFTFVSTEAGSTFQCSLDHAPPSPCTSPQTYSGLANGAHTFSVAATDPAGNVDPTPATASWTIDTTSPKVTLTAPAAGSYTNNATPTITGTAETKAGDSGVTVNVYAGTSATGTPVQALSASVQPGGGWNVNALSLTQGVYTVQAQQTNAVSTTGYSQQTSFTIDTTPPTVTLYTPVNGTHTNDPMPQITGTAATGTSDVASVTVTVSGVGSPVQTTATVSSSGNWNVYLPQALADGNYTVQAAQKDLAGNTGYSSSHLTIDTAPPQTFLDSAPVNVTSSTTATFAFHSTDSLSQAGSTYQCQIDGGNWSGCSSPRSYYNLANGSHTFAVEAVDGAGNVDTTGQTTTWTINTSLPAVTLATPAQGSSTNDTTPTFSGAAGTAPGDSSAVQVLIYSGSDLVGSPVQTLGATATSGGAWSVTPSSALADGSYVAYAQQVGAAGTATSDAHTFTVNTQPPTTTITVGPPGSSGTGVASFGFSASEPGSTFQCQLDGGGWAACTSPQYYSGLGNGSHTFQVRATDPAGNVGSAASQTWSVNTNLPALTLTSPKDGMATGNQAPTIAGTGGTASGDANTVTVNLYSGTSVAGTPVQTIITTVDSGTGAWTTHPGPLADGTYTVYAQQVGSAGTAYTQADTFTVDTTPPTTSITSEPQGATSSSSARFTFTSSTAGSTFECQIDGGAWTACTSPQSYSSLSTGAHSFSVRATDPAGNVDPNPPLATWTIDATIPVTLTAPADGTVTNNTTPAFSGAASAANGPVSVEIDDSSANEVETLTAGAGATWSATASPALPDGTYTAFASQLGSDGVTIDYSNSISFTVDTTPPAPTLTTSPSGTINDRTPSFGGAAGTASGDQGSVTVNLYSGSAASGSPVQTFSATPAGGSWSATAASLADGTYTARAQQSDAAGNTGYSLTRTFTIDATPPVTSITTGPAASTTVTNATFSFTSSKASSTFECRLDGGAWTACTSPWSYSSLSTGAHSFSVRATDAVGNVDPAPPSRTWTIADPGNPTPPGNPSPPGALSPSVTPSSGVPPTPAGNPPAAVALKLVLRATGTQHFRRRGAMRLLVTASCSQACKLTLAGKLTSTTRATRRHRAQSRTVLAPRVPSTKLLAGKLVKLSITLSTRSRTALMNALATKHRLTLTLSAIATVSGLRPASARVTINLIV